MATMAQTIKAYLQAAGGRATASQIREHVEREHAGVWRPGTLTAHLYACSVNQPRAYIHHPSADRFLYRADDGTFELYDPDTHGPNVWASSANTAPVGSPSDEQDVEELVEASISFERDVEAHLIRNLGTLEPGLKFIGRQEIIDVGRVDILAEDAHGQRVVIELKVGEAKDAAIGQIARYLGWYGRRDGKPARGMLIAGEFSDGVRNAALAIPGLTLVTYQVQFAFRTATVES